MRDLCKDGFYPSLSETVRIAITDYISHILEYTNQNESEFWLTPNDQQHLTDYNKIITKISACTKMPLELLNTIDMIIQKNQQFVNRTNFIRLAVNRFLEIDAQIYSQWLEKTVKHQSVSPNHVLIKLY